MLLRSISWLLLITMTRSQIPKIRIDVHTTSGCSDTAQFITQQLVPAYNKYRAYLDVNIIPWGKTTDSGCQFGAGDCYANHVQRCTIKLLGVNSDAILKYALCEFSSPQRTFLSGQTFCSQLAGVNTYMLGNCLNSPMGITLGNIARQVAAYPISMTRHVPTLVFNGAFNMQNHMQGIINLDTTICSQLKSYNPGFQC